MPDCERTLQPMGRFEWEKIYRRALVTPASVKSLGYTLATWASPKTGGDIFPGIKRLALLSGSSERQVMRGLKTLEDLGLIECTRRGSSYGRGGKGMASTYRLTIPSDLDERVEMVPAELVDQRRPVPDSEDDHVTPMSPDPLPEQVTPLSGDPTEQVTTSARTGDIPSGSGDSHVTPPLHELPLHELPPAAPPSFTSPGRVSSSRDAAEDQSIEDNRNDQLAALRARYADTWEPAATGTDAPPF